MKQPVFFEVDDDCDNTLWSHVPTCSEFIEIEECGWGIDEVWLICLLVILKADMKFRHDVHEVLGVNAVLEVVSLVL